MTIERRLQAYQITAVFSIFFALVGFSYNLWRLEASEANNNVRTACFEILKTLAELEQLIYARHYDDDKVAGNPRIGWVKVGLIVDMSALTSLPAQKAAARLQQTWQSRWSEIATGRNAVDMLTKDIDAMREAIKNLLATLN